VICQVSLSGLKAAICSAPPAGRRSRTTLPHRRVLRRPRHAARIAGERKYLTVLCIDLILNDPDLHVRVGLHSG